MNACMRAWIKMAVGSFPSVEGWGGGEERGVWKHKCECPGVWVFLQEE